MLLADKRATQFIYLRPTTTRSTRIASFHGSCGFPGLVDRTTFKGAAAQSWVLENRCPIPGAAPDVPSSNGYRPGFAAKLMAKDLRLAQMAAKAAGQEIPFGAEAARKFTEFAVGDAAGLDFSAYYRTLRPET